ILVAPAWTLPCTWTYPRVSDNATVLDSWSSAGNTTACVILGVCFLVGTPGNLLVVWTILKHVKQCSHTVLLILHLAAADLLVLITLPLWIYSLLPSSFKSCALGPRNRSSSFVEWSCSLFCVGCHTTFSMS
uniref:G-protein coupled receptors family 1 profile domain-containing protein n=1 Tax=Sinocyclocheilus anshuiensis TaxID=1608454 RepID=A0A671QS10_9TELE